LLATVRTQVAKRGGGAGGTTIDHPDIVGMAPTAVAHQAFADAVYAGLGPKHLN